jgi:hypothetical protein
MTVNEQLLSRLLIAAGVAVGLLLFAMVLAWAQIVALIVILALGWALTLPRHSELAFWIGVGAANSSILIPFLPGRPYLWEGGLLLAATGVPLAIAMRRTDPEFGDRLRRYKWPVLGLVLYLVVIAALMKIRGIGFQAAGSEQRGGRMYISQFICAAYPLLFLLLPLNPKKVITAYTVFCCLGVTYIVSDLALASGSGFLWNLLAIFGWSADAMGFEATAREGGIRRFQSIAIIARDSIMLILLFVPMNRILMVSRPFWFLLTLALLGAGALGGHRSLLLMVPCIALICAWAQRSLTAGRLVLLGVATVVSLIFAYSFARDLPLSAQRMLSVLPQISVDPVARLDAEGTRDSRNLFRRLGFEIAPNYYLVGRGLGYVQDVPTFSEYDPYGIIENHIQNGSFYTGAPSMLVNTGLPGTFAICLYLFGVTAFAVKNLFWFHGRGCESNIERLTVLVSAVWVVNLVFFFAITGDAAWVMRTFGMLSGMVLLTHWWAAPRAVSTRASTVVPLRPITPPLVPALR